MSTRSSLLCATMIVGAAIVGAWPVAAQATVTTRTLGPAITTSPVPFYTIRGFVTFPDGRVLVGDRSVFLLRMLDAALSHPVVVLDSMFGKPNTFPGNLVLMPFRGDSALYFDSRAGSLVVITPQGTLGRSIAPPPAGGRAATPGAPAVATPTGRVGPASVTVPAFAATANNPTVSATMGLIYRLPSPRGLPVRPQPGEPDITIHVADSVFVMRLDFATRKQDTLARIANGRVISLNARAVGTGTAVAYPINPLPFYDDVNVMADGSVVLFHAHEYRLEWIAANGTRTSARPTFPWTRVTDDDRQAILEQVNGPLERRYDSTLKKFLADSAAGTTRTGSRMSGGVRVSVQVRATPPVKPVLTWATDIPDYVPPAGPEPLFPDADNNVWIGPLIQRDSTLTLWEVIDRGGKHVMYVRVPKTYTIQGFGKGGLVYATSRDAGASVLQTFRIR